MGQPQQIRVSGIGFIFGGRHRQSFGLAEVDHFAASGEASQKGFVAPGRVNLKIGSQHVGNQLKPHLVVAAPGGSVAENAEAALFHFLYHGLGQDTAGNPSGVPVAPLIASLCLDQLHADFSNAFAHGQQDKFLCSGQQHPLSNRRDIIFVGLAQVSGKTDDVDTQIS